MGSMLGLVVRTHNRFYKVRMDGQTLLCSPKGNFRKNAPKGYHLPVIGDQVDVELHRKKTRGVDGYITKIHRRKNQLERSLGDGRRVRIMAANLDRIMITGGIDKPGIDWGLTDRYIVACELSGIPYMLVFNKLELNPDFAEDPFCQAYRRMDIPMIFTSTKTDLGMDALKDAVSDGISFFTGASGVGKSSLINKIVPEANLTTGAVDERKGLGKHTTTNSTLVPVASGYLVDSPGLRDFLPPIVPPEQVRFGFREMVNTQGECRFSTCLHQQEPGCAVKDAVDQGDISELRYKNYLEIVEEMQNYVQDRYS